MEHKTLYRNDETNVTSLAALPVERAVTSSSQVLQTSFNDTSLRLNPGEELRLFLFVGTADGTVISLRCTFRVSDGDGANVPANLVSVEASRRRKLADDYPPPGSAERARPAVSFLSISRELPLLFAVSNGHLECLRCTDLQAIGKEYFKRLQLPADAFISHCCTAKDQAFSQSPSVSLQDPKRDQDVQDEDVADVGQLPDGEAMAGGNSGGGRSGFSALVTGRQQRLALLTSSCVYLIECSKRGAFHMRREDIMTTAPVAKEGRRHCASLAAVLAVPANAGEVVALDWQMDTIVVGTRTSYIAYSTVTCLPLHRMDLGTSTSLPRLPSGAPFTPLVRYLSAASAKEEEDFGHSDDWAFIANLAAMEATTREAVEGIDDESNDRGIDDTGGSSNEWPASLLFRTPDGDLHLLDCLNDAGDGLHADLPAAPSLPTGTRPVTDALAISPFLVAYQANSDKGGGQFVLLSCYNRSVWATAAAYPCEGEGDSNGNGTVAAVCCPDAVIAVGAAAGVLNGLVATPVGLVGFTAHTIEAVLLKPPTSQLDALVAAGQYATALSYFLSGVDDILLLNRRVPTNGEESPLPGNRGLTSPVIDDNDDMDDAVDAAGRDYCVVEKALRDLYRTCAVHALSTGRYAEAFQFFARADTPVLTLLQLFPEFSLPAPSENEQQRGELLAMAARPLTLTYPHSETPYRILHEMLDYYFYANVVQVAPSSRDGEPNSSHEARPVEHALFLLYALDHGALGDRDVVATFFANATHLSLNRCLSYISGESAPYPRPDLVPLLLAGAGKPGEALRLCKKSKDVETASAVLRMPTAESELYEAHLPWMLRVNSHAAMTAIVRSQSSRIESHSGGDEHRRPCPSPADIVPILVGRGGGEALHAYLTHEIYACGSQDAQLHSLYATNMVDMLDLLNEVGLNLQGGPDRVALPSAAATPAGGEPGLLGTVRRALLQYLADETVAAYDEVPVLARLRSAGRREEQVVVLHRMGDHAAALRVLAYELDDIEGAVQYCFFQHERAAEEQRGNRNMGASLASMENVSPLAASPSGVGAPELLQPVSQASVSTAATLAPRTRERETGPGGEETGTSVDNSAMLLLPSRECLFASTRDLRQLGQLAPAQEDARRPAARQLRGRRESEVDERFNHFLHLLFQILWVPPLGEKPKTDAALQLLNLYSHLLDPIDILEFLPGDIPLPLLSAYLVRSFQTAEFDVGLCETEAAAACSVSTEAQCFCAKLQQRCVAVDGERLCAGCRQPVREKEPLVVFPNLKVTHFRCHQDSGLDPERGVTFRNLLL